MSPAMSIESLFLNASVLKLRTLTDRIGTCLDKLSEDDIWSRGHENENAIGNLVLHLSGNVRQWIVSGLGERPDTRQRDVEFSTRGGIDAASLKLKLRGTIDEAAGVLSRLTPEQLTRTYQIQNRQAAGLEAVYNVVEHFAQHAGQIIFATKNLTGQDLGLVMPGKPQA